MGDVLKHPGPPSDGGDGTILEQYRRDLAELERKTELCRQAIREEEGETGAAKLFLDFADLFDAALAMGTQFPTGFATIDKMTDGGLARGTVTIIQGKAGIGKTLVATQIARSLAPRCAIAGLFQDGGLALSRVQIGQQLGLDRRRMRRPDSLAKDEAVRAMTAAAAFWKFMRPTDKRATVETLAREFDRIAPPNLPRVWLIDSAQVARAEKTQNQQDRRLSTSDLLWLIHDLALDMNAIALVVSHVSRGSYASKDKEKRTEDLAAGAETAAIERVAELLLHIDGNPKQTVEIRCAKNRYTGEAPFSVPCRVDFPTATFHELDASAVQADKDVETEKAVHDAKKAILEIVAKSPGLSSSQIVAAALMRRTLVFAALKALQFEKAITCEKGTRNSMLWRVLQK